MRGALVKKVVVLSSGGVASTIAMAIAKAEGYEIYCLGFKYAGVMPWGRILGLFHDIIYE